MNKKILVIAAHPDDEILGAGGTIKKHVDNGDEVYCLILGQGINARKEKNKFFSKLKNNSAKEIKELQNQALKSAKIIGFKGIFLLNFKDNEFDSESLLNITKEVEKYIKKISPDIIYTHYENDLNIDHRITFRAVITACRPCNNIPSEIYSFEVLSSTEWQLEGEKFKPNVYIDIENEIETKISAFEKYKSEIRDYPHSRSKEGIKILAQYRGLECGKKYAEAFKLIRRVK